MRKWVAGVPEGVFGRGLRQGALLNFLLLLLILLLISLSLKPNPSDYD
ncbi:MAG: hypothetical protein QOE34_1646 [Verrucomicrobiota bacterium]|jgi:hypothetical protein